MAIQTKMGLVSVILWFLIPASDGFAQSSTAVADPADSQSLCQSDSESALRIAVVGRRGTEEFASILRGAREACESEQSLEVRLESIPYDEADAFDTIVALMSGPVAERPHLILGPTESSVFVNLENFAAVPDPTVPVVSPLVTVRSSDPNGSWFFQLNVDAAKRAQKIHQHLESIGVNNIAVLYEGNDFGESSEVAFRNVLTPRQESNYQSFRLEQSSDENYIPWLRRLETETRPEAVGVFGSRAVINRVTRIAKSLGSNGLFEYEPYLFSNIDLRPTYIDGMYFLSVAGNTDQEAAGEAVDLAYDSTKFIFMLVNGILNDGIELNGTQFPRTLRSRLANRINTDAVLPDTRTRMQFSGFSNNTEPEVLQFSNDSVVEVQATTDNRFLRAITTYFDLRERRYGSAMIINLLLIAIIVLTITSRDLTETLSVRVKDLFKTEFSLLLSFNVLTAGVVFVIVAETDLIDATWASTFTACVVAFGYVGLLNSTIFTTPAGEAVFARRHYENLVKSIYNNIRKRQYESLDPVINYIALANSQQYVRNALIASYGYDRDSAWQEKMTSTLDEELEGKTTIQQRRILAQRLLNEMRDKTLQQRRIIPKDVSREDVIDPFPVINGYVDQCMLSNTPSLEDSEAMVCKYQVNDERKKEFETEIFEAGTPRAKYAVCFRWIIILCGYNFFTNWMESGATTAELSPAEPVEDHAVKHERRKGKRAKFNAEALIETDEDNLVEKIVDIGVGGCRVATGDNKLNVNDNVIISTKLNEAPISLDNARGRVVHESTTGNNQNAVGIEWYDLLPRNQHDLESFIDSLEESGD